MRAKRATFTFFLSKQKFNKNAKNIQFAEFSKTVLPERSVLVEKLVKNAQI